MERLLLDDLTGAYQRAGLTELLEELATAHEREGTHFALAMLDVDHLKTLNDVYGHATGDAALKAVAARAASVLRAGDLLFRYGGDEFLLVLPGTTHEVAEAVARRVRDQVVANPVEAAVWVTVNISVGVASSDEEGRGASGESLFERADERLYLAKRVGRNTVVAADTPIDPSGDGPLLETRLVGRDEHLARIDAFLAASARTSDERVLHLTGAPGSGFTRLLNEVAVRAGIAGRVVRSVSAAAADAGVHLRALARAYEGTLPPDPAEDEVNERLAQDAEAHGLIVLLEGGGRLDVGSRILLTDRLRRGGVKIVEVVPTGEHAAFHPVDTVELAPLSAGHVADWLSAALGASVSPGTAEALRRAGGGLPAKTARIMTRLQRKLEDGGDVVGAEQLANAEPGTIHGLIEDESAAGQVVNLPQWDSPLVGRAHWLAGAKGAVSASRLSVLVGPGGVGKSRLAAQLALELAHAAPGGTYWIDLRGVTDAALVPGLIAEQAGLDPVTDAAELARHLGDQSLLLVIDELDGVADQVGWLADLLAAAPHVKLLGTSRMPLRLVGETHLNVPELTPAAAAELFRRGMYRVGASQPLPELQIENLIVKIGSSPLAVELASAWTRTLDLEELNERLTRRPELLTDAPGQAPLTTRFIDVTRDLMSADEREALGTLALIPAGFTTEAARVAADASNFYLLALLERSLIRREGERYTVHAAIAERYRSGLRDPHAARLRVAGAYSELARQIEEMSPKERSTRGYRKVDAERPNLFFALRTLAVALDEQAVWPLVKLLRGYLDVRGRAKEGLELFRHAQDQLATGPATELRCWVGETVALFKYQTGRAAEAVTDIRTVLDELEPLGATATAGLAWNTYGMLQGNEGQHDSSLRAFEVSATLREQLGDRVGEAQARGNMALVLSQMNRPQQALSALTAAARKYREVKHTSGVALTLLSLAELGRQSELLTLDERTVHARGALAAAEGIGYAVVARDAAGELATCLEEAGNLSDAVTATRRALEWARACEDQGSEAQLTSRLAAVTAQRDEWDRQLAVDGAADRPVS